MTRLLKNTKLVYNSVNFHEMHKIYVIILYTELNFDGQFDKTKQKSGNSLFLYEKI
jgi:hypothetical protein